MFSLGFQGFPEVYASDEAPGRIRAIDKERNLRTPPYMYGWVISRLELFEALNGEPCPSDRFLEHVYVGAERTLYDFWTEKGYEKNEYSPDIPNVRPVSVKYVVIFMACNDTDAVIKSIMENKKYHAACRAGLGNPKTMKLEPAWFRMDIKDLPKGFSDAVTVDQ